MQFSKLVTVLRSLDEERMKRLKEYIHSPYFKVPLAAVTLFDVLVNLHPDFAEKKMSAVAIGKKAKNLSTVAKQGRAGSELLQAVEHFIALENWQKDKNDVIHNQLSGFVDLHLFEHFEKEYEHAMKVLNDCSDQDINTFLYRHLNTELSFNGFNAKLKRTTQNDISPTLQTLDEYYALKKLRYMCEVLNRRKVFGGTSYHDAQFNTLMVVLKPYDNERYPYVYIFINVYSMLQAANYNESCAPYGNIKAFAARYTGNTLPQSIKEGLSYAISRCAHYYSRGHNEAGAEYLWWTEYKMRYDLLLENGKLMPITFRNIVSMAAVSNDNGESVKYWINNYAGYLPKQYYETNIAFAQGLYNYKIKNYKEALRNYMIAQAKDEAVFNCIIRRCQFICLYECDPSDTDTLLSNLSSFEKYLARKQDEMPFKAVFSKFILHAEKLMRASDNASVTKEIARLEKEEFFAGKIWLAEQLAAKQKIRAGGARIVV